MTDLPDRESAAVSPWDRAPDLVSLEFATWEHAKCLPKSFGRANRVADLRRLLPPDMSQPIYDKLAKAEALFLRRTEPVPPLQERLARDFDATTERHTLEGELNELLAPFLKFDDVIPDWDQKLAAALGNDVADVAQSISNFANQGLPRGDFSVWYGYQLRVRRVLGNHVRPPLATHSALAMQHTNPTLQPGPLREFCDRLFS